VGRLSKLFMYCSGPYSSGAVEGSEGMECEHTAKTNGVELSEGTRDILRFFSSIKPYFNPVSRWSCVYVNNMTNKSQSHVEFQSPISQMLVLGLSQLAPCSITCRMSFVIALGLWRQ
jgi:hypothetical protein